MVTLLWSLTTKMVPSLTTFYREKSRARPHRKNGQLEVVSCFVTMSKPKTALNNQKDQSSDIDCKTSQWTQKGQQDGAKIDPGASPPTCSDSPHDPLVMVGDDQEAVSRRIGQDTQHTEARSNYVGTVNYHRHLHLRIPAY